MIVWSRGLGKQRLPLDLANASLGAEPGYLVLKGVIEPVCWNYALRLTPADLKHFLRLMAQPETARFLSQRGGVLLPFLAGLMVRLPGLALAFLTKRRGPGGAKEEDHALLV